MGMLYTMEDVYLCRIIVQALKIMPARNVKMGMLYTMDNVDLHRVIVQALKIMPARNVKMGIMYINHFNAELAHLVSVVHALDVMHKVVRNAKMGMLYTKQDVEVCRIIVQALIHKMAAHNVKMGIMW